MNLLGKIKSIGALMLGLTLLFSCEKNGDFGFGSDDISPVEFSVETVGTSSSVVLLDSISSTNLGVGFIGNIDDPDFGKVKATSYAQMKLNVDDLNDISEEAILDSVKLSIKFGYLYKDFAKTARLKVSLLSEQIKDTLHITTNSTAISNELVASGNILIDELDSVYTINVNIDFANELFELMRNGSPQVATQEAFESAFPGLAFQTEDNSSNAFGIVLEPESSMIDFYYSEVSSTGTVNVPATHKITIGELTHYYGLEFDRSGTALEGMATTNQEYSPSSGLRYIQAGAGIVTKINLSELQTFANLKPDVIVNTAQVSIGPIDEPVDGVTPPTRLLLLLTDSGNRVIRDGENFRAIQQDGSNPIGSGTALTLLYDEDSKTYTGSITSFIGYYFSDVFRRNQFFIAPSSINGELGNVVFRPEDFKLKVFYSELK
ncbi:hypothetical protein AWN68_07145 [Roseivirga echinicomitans]|uniref:DUF4270 domain-containing protein n=1 Tax=Roseivirga echinicomitans TaxID=296218 RepID=A0A150XDM3_9BACT|nr:hypothetical protein AWN68_07145 [Roseivirga echinicomitans]